MRESDISELFGPEIPIRKYTPATIMKAVGRLWSCERASWRHQVTGVTFVLVY